MTGILCRWGRVQRSSDSQWGSGAALRRGGANSCVYGVVHGARGAGGGGATQTAAAARRRVVGSATGRPSLPLPLSLCPAAAASEPVEEKRLRLSHAQPQDAAYCPSQWQPARDAVRASSLWSLVGRIPSQEDCGQYQVATQVVRLVSGTVHLILLKWIIIVTG